MTTVEQLVPDCIRYTSVIFSALSLLGATYIGLSSLFQKRLRSFSFRMILWLCIFDFMLGCATICGPLGNLAEESGSSLESGEDVLNVNINIGNKYQSSLPLTCKLQAASIQFSIIASLLWTLCFAIHLFRITNTNININCTHSYLSFAIYILISIPLPAYLTYYIFDQNLVGISSDFWCWINNNYLEDWAYKMMYIIVGIIVLILFILYFSMKFHLKKFIRNSSNNNIDINGNNSMLILNRSRLTFVRTISGGLSSYLFAPFISFIPAHFNIICTLIGLESSIHVLSWYILSGLLLGILHIGIYLCGISIVRYSCQQCLTLFNQESNNNMNAHQIHNNNNQIKNRNKQQLQQSQKHYMELV